LLVVTTKYYPLNLVLLLVGIVVALVDAWLAVMTMGFGADPVHDLRSGAVMVVLWSSLGVAPACLIAFRWPKLSAIISFGIVGLSCLSVWASPVVVLFLILAAVEGLIANSVASRSEITTPTTVIPS
jgi:hypothetical protein